MPLGQEGNIQLGKNISCLCKVIFVFYKFIFHTYLLCGWVRWWDDCWVGGHHLDFHGYGGKFDGDDQSLI